MKRYQHWVPQVPILRPGRARTQGTKSSGQRPSLGIVPIWPIGSPQRKMKAVQRPQPRLQLLRPGLEQEQRLGRALDLALPAIDGFDPRRQGSAGHQPLLDQGAPQRRASSIVATVVRTTRTLGLASGMAASPKGSPTNLSRNPLPNAPLFRAATRTQFLHRTALTKLLPRSSKKRTEGTWACKERSFSPGPFIYTGLRLGERLGLLPSTHVHAEMDWQTLAELRDQS